MDNKISENKPSIKTENLENSLGPTGVFILIILFFMFSNKLIDIFWDIAKSILYLIILIFGLNIINPNLSTKLRNIITDLIDIDSENNFLKDVLNKLLNFIKPYVQDSFKKLSDVKNKSETASSEFPNNTATLGLPKKDLKTVENRDLQASTDTNNRRLIQ
jgi:hypothetical protein